MAVRLCLFGVGPDNQVLHLSYARVRRIQLGQETCGSAGGSWCLIVALIDLNSGSANILKQAFIKCAVDAKGYVKPDINAPTPIPPNIGTRDAEKFFEALGRLPGRWVPTKEQLLQFQLRAKRCAPLRAGRRMPRTLSKT
ncbi:MAG TPA: hypothetical protein VFA38_05275 [Nitrospirales bacterium]|nr:hypothetical protein [Nitrospirales bacterium]